MDLLGLSCLALAVYLGYVIYLGWNGGAVGNGTETALAHAVGGGAIVFPVALGIGGLLLILRPLLPSPRALAAGVFAICAGLLLALAAQTAGLGPDGTREELFDPAFFSEHGGGLGEVLYWASTTLFQRIGAHIIAVLLVAAGVLLVMGRSVSDLISAGHRGFSKARDGAADFVTLMRESKLNPTDDPDVVGTDPIDTDPVFGPPGAARHRPGGEPGGSAAGRAPSPRVSPTSTRPSASRRTSRTRHDQDRRGRRRVRPMPPRTSQTPRPERPARPRSSTSPHGRAALARRRHRIRADRLRGPRRRVRARAGQVPTRRPTTATTRRSARRCWRRSGTSASRRRSSAPSSART